MDQPQPLLRHISDTARWVAVYRARESERPDAVFSDPLARRLAGEHGERLAKSMQFSERNAWSFVARTYLFDQFIARQVQQGADMVINLAAGLDTRPYRMPLASTLQWIEVDLPEMFDYKEEILWNEKPVCALERVRLDLTNEAARRALFRELGSRAKKVVVVSEGFIVYLTSDEVAALAQDLAAVASFQRWITDLASPALLRMLQKKMAQPLEQGGFPLKFAPKEGPEFFTPHGWKPADVRGLLRTAAGLKRLSFGMRLLALLPDSAGKDGSRPWGGACLLQRQ